VLPLGLLAVPFAVGVDAAALWTRRNPLLAALYASSAACW
jgi:hypothetical protein